MALPSSGAISANMINVELGRSGSTALSLQSSIARNLADKPTNSSQISFSDFRGKSSFTGTHTWSIGNIGGTTGYGYSTSVSKGGLTPSTLDSYNVSVFAAGGPSGSTFRFFTTQPLPPATQIKATFPPDAPTEVITMSRNAGGNALVVHNDGGSMSSWVQGKNGADVQVILALEYSHPVVYNNNITIGNNPVSAGVQGAQINTQNSSFSYGNFASNNNNLTVAGASCKLTIETDGNDLRIYLNNSIGRQMVIEDLASVEFNGVVYDPVYHPNVTFTGAAGLNSWKFNNVNHGVSVGDTVNLTIRA